MNYVVETTDGEKGKVEDVAKIDVVDDLVYFMSHLSTIKLIVNKPVLKFIKPEKGESNE